MNFSENNNSSGYGSITLEEDLDLQDTKQMPIMNI